MTIVKQVFDLQHQWPVRRCRFWCHMLVENFPVINIPSWPISKEYSKLKDVMPLDAIWHPEEEQQLEWDESELAIYLNPTYGNDQRILQPDDQAPTMLHSWGHVNRSCPCGCRGAFSDARLRSGGARGFGLLFACTGCDRHLHPAEGALLCTVPPDFQFPMPVRSALSLLGQIAAPLQVLWVQSHILVGLQQFAWGWTGIDPSKCIHIFKQYLVQHSMRKWVTPCMYLLREIHVHVDGEDQIMAITLNRPTTVRDLAMAEKALRGWGHYAIVTHQGQRIPLDSMLQPNILYQIQLRQSAQVKPFNPLREVLGGGFHHASQGLGDRIIWTFMKALVTHKAQQSHMPAPWIIYPFRTASILQRQLPVEVQQSWTENYQGSNGQIFVICEIYDYWILLLGQKQQQSDGLSWTLHDGLRQGHLLMVLAEVAQKIGNALDLDFAGIQMGHGLCQTQESTCGTIALVQMALDLRLIAVDDTHDVLQLHCWLRAQQQLCHIIAAGPDDAQKHLAEMIATKGVPQQDR